MLEYADDYVDDVLCCVFIFYNLYLFLLVTSHACKQYIMYKFITMNDVKGMSFGTRRIGVHFSIKLRFSMDTANSILDQLKRKGYANDISVCHTDYKGKPYTYITAVVHRNSGLIDQITIAKKLAKATKLVAQALELREEAVHINYVAEQIALPF